MKKVLICILPILLSFSLCGCYQAENVNLLHFTDNLNRIRENEKISLSDYIINGQSYKLILGNETPVLLTAEESEEGKIEKIRLTIGKTDEKGNVINLSSKDTDYFAKTSREILEAFTFFSKDECEELVSALLPADFSKTGESVTDKGHFHLVCYSNKLCLQFFVTNTFLCETESTSKPE